MPSRQVQPLHVALVSLGCPKNLVDSERMMGILAEAGCVVGAPADDADVIVINTCGFLSAARDESLEFIGQAVDLKQTGRVRRVVVAGCLASRDAEALYESADGIDAIVGVDNRHDILAAVVGEGCVTKTDGQAGPCGSDAGRLRLTLPHTAYLRIAEGCSQKCSFCTIPAIRGPFRSKSPSLVLDEARELIADGAAELNIIAQDTTAYGSDGVGGVELASLLRSLDALDGANWLRLMYAYPRRFDDELIDAIAGSEHVVPYVDMPLQHIDDAILRRMGRGVSRKTIEELLHELRERVADLTIRTTFIVGFPGESDRNFAELLDFVQDFKFDALGVFEFSPEPGTRAAEMPNQVPDAVKAERAEAVMLAQQAIVFDANEDKISQEIEVLVDGLDAEGRCIGRHRGQAPDIDGVCYLTSPCHTGDIVAGRIVDYEDYDLIVEPQQVRS